MGKDGHRVSIRHNDIIQFLLSLFSLINHPGYEGEKNIIVGECHILFIRLEVEIVYDLLSSLSLED